MKKHIFSLVLVLCACINNAAWSHTASANLHTLNTQPANEGHSISGHVIEAATEEDLPFATVQVVGVGKPTATDEAGHFKIKNLAPGKYTLRVSAIGFKAMEKEVEVSRDFVALVHFPLEEETFVTDEVVVSATRNATRRTDAPVVVNVMSQKLFEMVNSTDLAQSLSYQSGLRVENNCQNCGFPQVRINGLEGPYSQILINSRPVMSALSGVYGLEQIPVNMIERVEVVRGGGSALFGANAVGGTINIITKDPVENSFQANTTLSSVGGQSWAQYMGANASLVSKDYTYGIALYESFRHRNPYDRNGDGFSEIGKLGMNTFGLRAYYRPSHQSRLELEYHTTNEHRRGGNAFDLPPHQSDIAEQTQHTINSGGANYSFYMSELKHKLSLYTSVQHTSRDSYYGAQRDPNAYGKTHDLTWVAGAQYVSQMEKCIWAPATFTSGTEYQQNTLDDQMTGYKRHIEQRVGIASLYAQNEWHMRQFTLLAGLRMDRHNLIERLIYSPRLNLMYKPSPKLQARLTYSTGFRAPQAYDEDLHVAAVGGEGVQIRLADKLREERSNSFSGSVDYSLPLGHWQANLLLEGFYTQLDNVFVLEEVGRNAQGYLMKERRNGSGAHVYGANIDAKIAHGRHLSLQLGLTAQRSRYKRPEVWATVDGQNLATSRMPRTPNLYGYFTVGSTPFTHFDIALTGTYTGSMQVPHMAGYIAQARMEHTPVFAELNLKCSYTFVLHDHIKLQLNAGAHNLFNSFQKDLDKGERRDSGYFYGPTQPRTLFVGLKISR